MVRDPGLVMRGTGWAIARWLTGGDVPARYYCLEMVITRKAKASAHKARVTICVLDDLDASPPSLYILG